MPWVRVGGGGPTNPSIQILPVEIQMANFNPSRLGQVNTAGDAKAMFLKVFGGEILKWFYAKNVTLSRHMVRTITHGKSAAFPVMGQGTAQYHTPGVELTGTLVPKAERVIEIDDKLVADRFIADIDEAMNHFDIRGIYSKDMGEQLARAWDRQVLQLGVQAARAAATVTGGFGGSIITAATSKTDAAVLRKAILDAAAALADKDVPLDEVCVFVRPAQYYLLVDDAKLTNKDWTSGNGGIDVGRVKSAAGFDIVMTNNLPITNVNTGLAKYQVNASTTSALVLHPSAVGTVKLMDLAVEQERSIRHQGHLMVASYAIGSGILRPDCAVEIRTGVPA
jgi:hypothetical protein